MEMVRFHKAKRASPILASATTDFGVIVNPVKKIKQIRVVPGTESFDNGKWVDVPDSCVVEGRWDEILPSVGKYCPAGHRVAAAREIIQRPQRPGRDPVPA